MKIYTAKSNTASPKTIVLDDMLLTKAMPTMAGSRMLEGFYSLFDCEVLTRLESAGYVLGGKCDVGEFAIDLVGETSYNGAITENGALQSASASVIKSGEAVAVICLDVNGSVRRTTAQNGLVSIKPTYGTVSRFGTVAVACSGETVSVMADSADKCAQILDTIAGHDAKDGTSLCDELCDRVKSSAPKASVKRVAIISSSLDGVDSEVMAKIDTFKAILAKNGVEVCVIDSDIFTLARPAWNILMCSELCNNVSRYDGVKYGYRSSTFTTIDELYTNSRTEAFGELLKSAILFGSDNLSDENYDRAYDKALRTRRVIVNALNRIFGDFDAILSPACSKMAYTPEDIASDKYISFTENAFSAPASISGLPCVVCGGVSFIGRAFSEGMLLDIARMYEEATK